MNDKDAVSFTVGPGDKVTWQSKILVVIGPDDLGNTTGKPAIILRDQYKGWPVKGQPGSGAVWRVNAEELRTLDGHPVSGFREHVADRTAERIAELWRESCEARAARQPDAEAEARDVYPVLAHRYGHHEGHTYLVGVFDSKSAAIKAAEHEEDYRGGKYRCSVWPTKPTDTWRDPPLLARIRDAVEDTRFKTPSVALEEKRDRIAEVELYETVMLDDDTVAMAVGQTSDGKAIYEIVASHTIGTCEWSELRTVDGDMVRGLKKENRR